MDTMQWLDWLTLTGEGVIAVLLPLELWRLWRRRQLDWTRVREMLASASVALPVLLGGAAYAGLLLWLFNAVHALAPVQWPINGWSALACVLLVDFLYYWDHRLGHEVRLFWALGHSVHHSSPVYDQSTALRVSLLDGPFTVWIYLPAPLFGFHPLLVLGAFGLVLAYQTWLHTETVGKLRWLDPWLNTPSNHRVHHGSQPAYLDRNYGAILMLWDRWFGTYAAETEPVRYGLTEPIRTVHPLRVHFHELQRLWREWRPSGWRRRWRLLWARPGAQVATDRAD